MNVIEKPVSINAIKKLNYTGSYCGMRYMLEKKDDRMAAHTYPEPFNYEKTPEEKIVTTEFPFSEEGYAQAIEWLNEQYTQRKELWDSVKGKLLP